MIDAGVPMLLVGCGKMGSALLSGWIERGVEPSQVSVVEQHPDATQAATALGARVLGAAAELEADFAPAVVVFAVKPQQMDQVLPDVRRFAASGSTFLSIAAGKTIAYFTAGLGDAAAVVRAMPNTPAAVGRGMSVLVANDKANAGRRELCERLLASVGEVAWVEDEALLDAVTAVSGGGPAYVFLLIETLAKAGVEAGLPEVLSLRLARVTVAGAGELVHQAAEPVSRLRENVTSPGGTTLEALKVLMAQDGLQPLMTRAIAAATRRSRELAS